MIDYLEEMLEDPDGLLERTRELERPFAQRAEGRGPFQPPEEGGDPAEDRGPDSSTDVEQYMDDQYWPEDLTQSTGAETNGGPDRQEGEEGQGARSAPP